MSSDRRKSDEFITYLTLPCDHPRPVAKYHWAIWVSTGIWCALFALCCVIGRRWTGTQALTYSTLFLVPASGYVWAARRLTKFRARVRELEYRVCPHCAYPLDGLGDAGSCPECGLTFTLEGLRDVWITETVKR